MVYSNILVRKYFEDGRILELWKSPLDFYYNAIVFDRKGRQIDHFTLDSCEDDALSLEVLLQEAIEEMEKKEEK